MSVYDTDQWRAFIAAIRANPADDTPRLVAADWLDEHGERDRAEFIRVHLAYYAARHSHRRQSLGGEPCRKCKLKRRLKRLWHLPGKGLPNGIWGRLPVDGFLTVVDCSAADWLAHGDAVLAREPVERVSLTTWPELTFHGPNYSLAGDPADRWFNTDALPSPADGIERRVLSARWPGVKFVLPSEPITARADPAGVTFRLDQPAGQRVEGERPGE